VREGGNMLFGEADIMAKPIVVYQPLHSYDPVY